MNQSTAFLLALLLGLLAGIGAVPDKGFVWTDVDNPDNPHLSVEIVERDRPIDR